MPGTIYTEIEKGSEDFHNLLRALQEARDQLENLISTSLDPIIICDAKGYVVKINKAFLDLIGYSEDEIMQKRIYEFTPLEQGKYECSTGEQIIIGDEYFEEVRKCISELVENGKISNWNGYYLNRDHKLVPVVQNIVFMYSNEGERSGTFAIIRDITKQRPVSYTHLTLPTN